MTGPVTLDYAKGRSRWRKWVGRGIVLLMILGVVFAGWHWRRNISQHVMTWYWQEKCADFSMPPREIVLEMDPAGASALLIFRPGEYLTFSSGAGRHIRPIDEFWVNCTGVTSKSSPGVFAHERTSRGSGGGKKRIVFVNIVSVYGRPILSFDVLRPGHLARLAEGSHSGANGADIGNGYLYATDQKLRVYAGQADMLDLSHFTFDYEQWGQRDTMDGWLEADDSITLKPRKPPVEPAAAQAEGVR
jgi:hypothetical protein